jgi:hypothetical protein
VLEAKSDTKFQLLPLFNIVGPFLGLTRNLGARQLDFDEMIMSVVAIQFATKKKLKN